MANITEKGSKQLAPLDDGTIFYSPVPTGGSPAYSDEWTSLEEISKTIGVTDWTADRVGSPLTAPALPSSPFVRAIFTGSPVAEYEAYGVTIQHDVVYFQTSPNNLITVSNGVVDWDAYPVGTPTVGIYDEVGGSFANGTLTVSASPYSSVYAGTTFVAGAMEGAVTIFDQTVDIATGTSYQVILNNHFDSSTGTGSDGVLTWFGFCPTTASAVDIIEAFAAGFDAGTLPVNCPYIFGGGHDEGAVFGGSNITQAVYLDQANLAAPVGGTALCVPSSLDNSKYIINFGYDESVNRIAFSTTFKDDATNEQQVVANVDAIGEGIDGDALRPFVCVVSIDLGSGHNVAEQTVDVEFDVVTNNADNPIQFLVGSYADLTQALAQSFFDNRFGTADALDGVVPGDATFPALPPEPGVVRATLLGSPSSTHEEAYGAVIKSGNLYYSNGVDSLQLLTSTFIEEFPFVGGDATVSYPNGTDDFTSTSSVGSGSPSTPDLAPPTSLTRTSGISTFSVNFPGNNTGNGMNMYQATDFSWDMTYSLRASILQTATFSGQTNGNTAASLIMTSHPENLEADFTSVFVDGMTAPGTDLFIYTIINSGFFLTMVVTPVGIRQQYLVFTPSDGIGNEHDAYFSINGTDLLIGGTDSAGTDMGGFITDTVNTSGIPPLRMFIGANSDDATSEAFSFDVNWDGGLLSGNTALTGHGGSPYSIAQSTTSSATIPEGLYKSTESGLANGTLVTTGDVFIVDNDGTVLTLNHPFVPDSSDDLINDSTVDGTTVSDALETLDAKSPYYDFNDVIIGSGTTSKTISDDDNFTERNNKYIVPCFNDDDCTVTLDSIVDTTPEGFRIEFVKLGDGNVIFDKTTHQASTARVGTTSSIFGGNWTVSSVKIDGIEQLSGGVVINDNDGTPLATALNNSTTKPFPYTANDDSSLFTMRVILTADDGSRDGVTTSLVENSGSRSPSTLDFSGGTESIIFSKNGNRVLTKKHGKVNVTKSDTPYGWILDGDLEPSTENVESKISLNSLIKNTDFETVSNTRYYIEVLGSPGPLTVSFPADTGSYKFTPLIGDIIELKDYNNTWGVGAEVTFDLQAGGSPLDYRRLVEGSAVDLVFDVPGTWARFEYIGGSVGWSMDIINDSAITTYVDFQTAPWETTPITGSGSPLLAVVETSKSYFVDTTGGEITIELPIATVVGEKVRLKDYASTFDTNKMIVDATGTVKIEGVDAVYEATSLNECVEFTWSGATQGWKITSLTTG